MIDKINKILNNEIEQQEVKHKREGAVAIERVQEQINLLFKLPISTYLDYFSILSRV